MNKKSLLAVLMAAILGHAQAADDAAQPQDDTAALLNGSVMPPMPEDAPPAPEEPAPSAIAIDVESKQANTAGATTEGSQSEPSEASQESDSALEKNATDNHAADQKQPASQSSDADAAGSGQPVDNQNNTDSDNKNIELELITRAIYQCLDSSGQTVFVDGEHRPQYKKCIQIRAAHYQQTEESTMEQQQEAAPAARNASPCAGALVYQGSTYIFSDIEPCPIPDSIFKKRKPIEANPEYYAPQS